MGTAKVVALRARPWKVTQLCFEVGGILDQIPATLGSSVTPFNFGTFYSGLGATAPGDGSLLKFNSQAILTAPPVSASSLASLRAEPRKAALDRAVSQRQNAFYARYANIPNIVTTATSFYGTAATAKPQRLQNLVTLSQTQADQLAAAYTADGRTGVVRNTNSSINSTTTTTDSSDGSGQSTSSTQTSASTSATGQNNLESIGAPDFGGTTTFFPQPPPAGGGPLFVGISDPGHTTQETWQEGTTGSTSNQTGTSNGTQNGTSSSTGQAYAVETQSIVNTDYGYRVPAVESQAQNERAQISLIDQQFSQFLAGQNLPNLTTVMQNELSAMDLGVYQLQIAVLNTILLSPIAGVVTGVYKNPGDCVGAGEPVIRVEDNTTIFLLGTFVYRGAIKVGSTVSVTTNLFDAGGAPTSVSGSVVALRSRGDDDQWDVVVQCTNPLDGSGAPTFPSGYVFDYDNTTVTVT
jgi:hypothetical protein